MFLHRYHDLQHKDAVFAFDGALPVVFVHGGADVGQAEAVEQGVFFGCLAAGVSVRQGVVFHRDDEHVVDAAGFYGDDAPGNGEFFAGFEGVIEALPKMVLISSGSRKLPSAKWRMAVKSICFSRAVFALSRMMTSR